jgi:alkylation response protein AidB-like acyl-CoA dehydrogenase
MAPMDLGAERPWWPLGDVDQFREALQHWVSRNWKLEITVGDWWENLASAGLTVPTWQRAYGGLGATTPVQQVVEEELANVRAVAPPVEGVGIRVVGPALRQFATAAQLAESLPGMLTGQESWALLLNDPGSSDPGDTSCRAHFDWKYVTVEGAKTIVGPSTATRAIALVRSSDETGRRGLSWIFVDLRSPEISVDGDTARFEGMRMTPEQVLGQKDDGWSVVKVVTPYFERSLAGRIRRGMVHCEPGVMAGNLSRTVDEVIQLHRPSDPPAVDRRQR